MESNKSNKSNKTANEILGDLMKGNPMRSITVEGVINADGDEYSEYSIPEIDSDE